MVVVERVKRPYPVNWVEIREAVRERAGYTCEHCGVAHGQPHPERGHMVYLHTAHKDESVYDVAAPTTEMFLALCQGCHLAYDKVQHAATSLKAHGLGARGFDWKSKEGNRKTAPRYNHKLTGAENDAIFAAYAAAKRAAGE